MKEQSVIIISDIEKGTDKSAHILKRELNGSVVDLIAEGKVMSAVKPDALKKLNLNPAAFTHRTGLVLQDLLAELETLRAENQTIAGKLKTLAEQNRVLAEQNEILSDEISAVTAEMQVLSEQPETLPDEKPMLPDKKSAFTDASLSLYAMNYIVAFIAVLSIMTSLPNFLGFGISLPIFLMWHSTIQFLRGRSAQEYEQVKGVFTFGLFVIGVSEIVFHWVGFNITLSDTSVQVAYELFGIGKWGQSLFIALLFTFIQLTAIAINIKLKQCETQ